MASVGEILWVCETDGEEATQALGRRLGELCGGGEVIALDGVMGAGKTCLTGGLAQGLGIAEPAVSPTFVIMRTYAGAGGLRLFHFDLYRLTGENDLETVGYEECIGPGNVVVVEWPSRCPTSLADFSLALRIEVLDATRRRITARAGTLPFAPGLACAPAFA